MASLALPLLPPALQIVQMDASGPMLEKLLSGNCSAAAIVRCDAQFRLGLAALADWDRSRKWPAFGPSNRVLRFFQAHRSASLLTFAS